ncbi:MAG: hypothetical protein GVY18_10430, partial [Bacteroidetes bacterium]|nr:hypothetical protein [Bacteroidota bacterium]
DEHTSCLGAAAIDALLHHEDAALRAALAEVLAQADDDTQQYLTVLAGDDDPDVRRAAVRSMGAARHSAFVPVLIDRLEDDPVHVEAWNALSRYGGTILDELVAAFEAPDTSAVVRRRLPRVLSAIPEQRSVDLLMTRLRCEDPVLRHNVTTALHRLRMEQPEVEIPVEPVEDALRCEAGIYYGLAQSIQWAKGEDARDTLSAVSVPDHVPPLPELLDDHLDRSARRIFYLLGLYCPEHAVRHAYTAYTSDKEHLRALAVEWLNSVLDYDLRQLLGPIIDPPSLQATAETGARLLGQQVHSLEDALLLLIDGPDPRLQACAFYHAAAAPSTTLIDRARDATDDVDERVRTAAAWMLEHVSTAAE